MVYKCKMCGASLDIEEGHSVVTCEFCGTQQTVNSFDDEKKTHSLNAQMHLDLKMNLIKRPAFMKPLLPNFLKRQKLIGA